MKVDDKVIKATLADIAEDLRKLDERREALLTAHRGLEALLTLSRSGNGSSGMRPLFTVPSSPGGNRPKGLMSLRGSVLRVMRESGGHPLHVTEVLSRATRMGASTSAKDPHAIVDLMLYSLKKAGMPVEKTAPRTWRWAAR